jgi:anti-anti-sigma factor
MSAQEVVTIVPHEEVVLGVVNQSNLNDVATEKLDSEVTAASNAVLGLPVVLDLAKVKFIPSVALGALINLRKGLKLQKRLLILVGVNKQVRGVLKATRLDQLIEVYDRLDIALAAIRRRSA